MRVAVVGGGIIGCACAFELARRGADVTVFDMRHPGGGATQASAGILAPYVEGHANEALLDLGIRGLDAYDEFVTEVRRAADVEFEYRRSGSLELADSEARSTALLSKAKPLLESGVLEWLDSSQVSALEPAVRTTQCGGLLCRVHGHVAVAPFMTALVRAAQRIGVAFRTGRVVDASFDKSQCAVITGEDRFHFDRIVLSTGGWASLLDPLGEIRDAIKPIRGELVVLSWSSTPIQRVLWGPSCYIVPWQDGTLLVGATAEDVGFDERATVRGLSDAAGGRRRPASGSRQSDVPGGSRRPAPGEFLWIAVDWPVDRGLPSRLRDRPFSERCAARPTNRKACRRLSA